MKYNHHKERGNVCTRGFTLSEILVVASALVLISTVGVKTFGAVEQKVSDNKLVHDVATINAAVSSYRASGGSLVGASNAAAVVGRLKNHAQVSQQSTMVGFKGATLDPRLTVVLMNQNEQSDNKKRAHWDSTLGRFVIRESGTGIKEFLLSDDELVNVAAAGEVRAEKLSYAAKGDWVWDYAETDLPAVGAPQDVSMTVSTVGMPLPDLDERELLAPPNFSMYSSSHDYSDFPKQLDLSNPNSGRDSTIMVSLNRGPWFEYSGPINVLPDTEVAAYTASDDQAKYINSFVQSELYEAIPEKFSGAVAGIFKSAVGGPRMNVSYDVDENDVSSFYFGTAPGINGWNNPNHLKFEGSSFIDLEAGSLFQLGTLDYYNGSTYGGTAASGVTLALDFALSNPEVSEVLEFQFDLESTNNNGFSADLDADYVRLGDISTNFETRLNGRRYALQLQFGYFGDDGFSTVDQFHVHENAQTAANIYGVFVVIDSEDE